MQITPESQYELSEQINAQFKVLAEAIAENPVAGRLLWEINGKFITYVEHSRILTNQEPKPMVNLGGY